MIHNDERQKLMHCSLWMGLLAVRPASRCGTETWPDLRLKWPQVDRRRLHHIRLDLTWLDSCMWLESTSNDFRSSEVMMNLRDTPFFAQIDHYHAEFTMTACISYTATL